MEEVGFWDASSSLGGAVVGRQYQETLVVSVWGLVGTKLLSCFASCTMTRRTASARHVRGALLAA